MLILCNHRQRLKYRNQFAVGNNEAEREDCAYPQLAFQPRKFATLHHGQKHQTGLFVH